MKLRTGQSYQAKNGARVDIEEISNSCYVGFWKYNGATTKGEWLEGGTFYSGEGKPEDDDLTIISIWGEAPPEPETRVSRETAEIISKGLEGIVARFNEEFRSWMETTGCRANFEWRYDGEEIKKLGIKDIDAMIYRKPVPNWKKETPA